MAKVKPGSQDFVFEEWKNLRTELAIKQATIERITLVAGMGCFSILAFGLSDKCGCKLLGVICLLIPTIIAITFYVWVLKYSYSGVRIASYIRSQLEPKLGFGWEKWLNDRKVNTTLDDDKSRSKSGLKEKVNKVPTAKLLAILMACISVAASIFKFITINVNLNDPQGIHYTLWGCVFLFGSWATLVLSVYYFLAKPGEEQLRQLKEKESDIKTKPQSKVNHGKKRFG